MELHKTDLMSLSDKQINWKIAKMGGVEYTEDYNPIENWAQAGSILVEKEISIFPVQGNYNAKIGKYVIEWGAIIGNVLEPELLYDSYGESYSDDFYTMYASDAIVAKTPLRAAMLCYIKRIYGINVYVPTFDWEFE